MTALGADSTGDCDGGGVTKLLSGVSMIYLDRILDVFVCRESPLVLSIDCIDVDENEAAMCGRFAEFASRSNPVIL